MTTDEALDFCKRFDDPKLQACMGTDFSRATGTVGALLALRAELETAKARAEFLETSVPSHIYDELMDLRDSVDTLRGKLRELDAWLTEKGEAQSDQFGNYGDSYREGKADAYDAASTKLRELGLLEAKC